jgi:hypothetical protein
MRTDGRQNVKYEVGDGALAPSASALGMALDCGFNANRAVRYPWHAIDSGALFKVMAVRDKNKEEFVRFLLQDWGR